MTDRCQTGVRHVSDTNRRPRPLFGSGIRIVDQGGQYFNRIAACLIGLNDLIAKGGMGEVYQAHATRLKPQSRPEMARAPLLADTERMRDSHRKPARPLS